MNLYNVLFGILLTAGLAVGMYTVGPATFVDEARSLVGMEEEMVFVRPPMTAEETPQAAPVNPASVPAEQLVEEPAVAPAPASVQTQGLQFSANWRGLAAYDADGHSLLGQDGFAWVLSTPSGDMEFPDNAYAVYEFMADIRNNMDTPVTIPYDFLNLNFIDGEHGAYYHVSGPYNLHAIFIHRVGGQVNITNTGSSFTIAPDDSSLFTLYFSIPTSEVNPIEADLSSLEPALLFGDIGPQWAMPLDRGNLVSSYCYGDHRICDY